MPWQEQSIMALKVEFVMLAEQEGVNLRELCRRYGISPPTAYKWLERFRTEGPAGLAERSRRPIHSPGQTSPEMEERVLALRDAHRAWGGRKLRARLLAQGVADVPSASTVTAILRRHGRLDPAAAAQHTAWRRFEQAASNDLWQRDFKGHCALADVSGRRCHPLTVLDDHARFLLGLVACADEREATVQAAATALFRRSGLPWRILTDHGPPWGAPYPLGALTALGVWLLRLGVALVHGRPGHPQTQGKAERFHRTLLAELLRDHADRDLAEAQIAFDGWRTTDNQERPHEALALGVPATRYQASARPFPEERPPLLYGDDDEVRTVGDSGQLSYRGRAWFVSQALRGQRLALRPTPIDGVRTIHFGRHGLGALDLRQPETELLPPDDAPSGAEV